MNKDEYAEVDVTRPEVSGAPTGVRRASAFSGYGLGVKG